MKNKILSINNNNNNILKSSILNTISDTIGYGHEQFKIIILAGLCFMTQGFYFYLNTGLFIPIKTHFNITENMMAISSSMCYLSGIAVTFFTGHLSSRFGRIKIVRLTLILTVFLHFLLLFIKNFLLFCFVLMVIGGCINLNVPILTNILIEYLPIKYRAITMGFIWGWYSLGNIFLLCLYWIVMPEYSADDYNSLLLIFISLPFITMVLCFIFLKDSPRSLIINGQVNEGINILSRMYMNTNDYKSRLKEENTNDNTDNTYDMTTKDILLKRVFSVNDKKRMINEIKSSNLINDDEYNINTINNTKKYNIFSFLSSNNKGYSHMFSLSYKSLSYLLILLWLLISIIGYGLLFILPLTLSTIKINGYYELEPDPLPVREIEIIKSQLFISLFGLISNPIGGVLSDLPSFGRIKTGLFSVLIGGVSCILTVYDINNIVFYMSILNISNTISFNTTITYTSEAYPTYIRDYSSGVFNSIGNFGSMISQPLFLILHSYNVKYPYLISFFLSIFCFFIYISLPFETRGRELDECSGEINLRRKSNKDDDEVEGLI